MQISSPLSGRCRPLLSGLCPLPAPSSPLPTHRSALFWGCPALRRRKTRGVAFVVTLHRRRLLQPAALLPGRRVRLQQGG